MLDSVMHDTELRQLLSDQKIIKAIKRCRFVTGCDLLTPQEYVDSKI